MKSLLVPIVFILFLGLTGCNQEKPPMKEKEDVDMSIVRTGYVEVDSIDQNKDGKLYQCPMESDYEVIADDKTTCPKCKMNLEEFPKETVKERYSAIQK